MTTPFFPSDDAWDATGDSLKANDGTFNSTSGGFDGFDDDDDWGSAAKPASAIDPKSEVSKPVSKPTIAIDITSTPPSSKEPPITRALSPKNNPNPPSMKLDDLRSSDGSESGSPRTSGKAPASPQTKSTEKIKSNLHQHSSPPRKEHLDTQSPEDPLASSAKFGSDDDPSSSEKYFDDVNKAKDAEMWKKRAELAQRTEVSGLYVVACVPHYLSVLYAL